MAISKPSDVYDASLPETGQTIEWDAKVPGLGLRLTAGGSRAFILQYRFADPTERRKSASYRCTIGPARESAKAPGWSLEEARKEADKWRKEIARGVTHPLAERRGNRAAVKAAREAETFKDAFADYIEHEQKGRKGNASAGEVERAILKDCAEWLAWPVKDITAAHIGKLLREVRDGNKDSEARPYMANRLYAYLRTFFMWCARPDVSKVPTSPMLGMVRPWEGEEVRDRVFTDKELKAIWKAADTIGGTGGALVKVIMLTGKRKSAVAAMQWPEIDDNWTWTPPADKRRRKRTKRLHGIPLPKLAQRIIAPLRPKEGDKDVSLYVFPGRERGTHLYPGSDLSDDIKGKSGVSDFFYHALRHTAETKLAKEKDLKVPPHIRDLLFDHVSSRGSGEGYDHYDYSDELLEALEKWAAHIERLVSPKGVSVLR
jgi:integrase